MKFILSITQIPELTGLTSEQRRMVLIDFSLFENMTERARRKFNFTEVALVGVIVFAEIAGFLGGYFVWRTPFWGPVCGALIAFCAVAVPSYLIGTQFAVRRLRRYLQSEEGERMVALIKSTPPKGAAPNGGPATQLGNSRVTEGPPSVS
jgi:hypothetical protein